MSEPLEMFAIQTRWKPSKTVKRPKIEIKPYTDFPTLTEVVSKVVGYKIKRADGLYSTGSAHPKWAKNGKTWSTKNALHCHFALLREYAAYARRCKNEATEYGDDAARIYAGCQLVSLIESVSQPMEAYVQSIK